MRTRTSLFFESQGDCVEISGEMVLAVILLKVDYEDVDSYRVVDVDSKEEWSGVETRLSTSCPACR